MADKQGCPGRGYFIRIQRAGDWFHREEMSAFGVGDELPTEWQAVGQDETVQHAELLRSNQRRRSVGRRYVLAEYRRQ